MTAEDVVKQLRGAGANARLARPGEAFDIGGLLFATEIVVEGDLSIESADELRGFRVMVTGAIHLTSSKAAR